jgi:hypothetical protein
VRVYDVHAVAVLLVKAAKHVPHHLGSVLACMADRKQRVIVMKYNPVLHMRCVVVRVVVEHNSASACHKFLESGINLLRCATCRIDLLELKKPSTNSKPG